jgi:transcriptional regulator of acetoin/glycerol metabolism
MLLHPPPMKSACSSSSTRASSGQKEACHAGVRIVTRSMSRLRTTGCAGFYALQGEPGVGKTELVKRICEYVHGDASAFVLIDGGLLQNDHQVNALVGAPPGYTGYEEPGSAAKRRAAEKELLKKLKEENPELAAKYKTLQPPQAAHPAKTWWRRAATRSPS